MKILRDFNEELNVYTVIDNCNLNIATYNLEQLEELLKTEKIKGCKYVKGVLTFREILEGKRLLETNISNSGFKMTIIKYINYKNITVHFEDGFEKKCTYGSFKRGEVHNDDYLKNKRIGEKNRANNGMMMTIIDCDSKTENITVRFEDGFEKKCQYHNFKSGCVYNPNIYKELRTGEKNRANNGLMMTITGYKKDSDIIVTFENGIEQKCAYCAFKRGDVSNPLKVNGNRSTSEKIIAFYLGKFIHYTPSFKASWLKRSMEYDLFLNNKIAIEYDSYKHHFDKPHIDELKNNLTTQNSNNVSKLIRIREEGLPELPYNENVVNFMVEKIKVTNKYFKSLENCIKDILKYLEFDFNEDEIIVDRNLYRFCKSEEFLKYEFDKLNKPNNVA